MQPLTKTRLIVASAIAVAVPTVSQACFKYTSWKCGTITITDPSSKCSCQATGGVYPGATSSGTGWGWPTATATSYTCTFSCDIGDCTGSPKVITQTSTVTGVALSGTTCTMPGGSGTGQ